MITHHKPKRNVRREGDTCSRYIQVAWREVFSQVFIVCRMNRARELLCESRTEFEEMGIGGDGSGQIGGTRSIGETLMAQGYYAQSEAHCEQALRIFREIRGPRREGRALCWLGLIRYHQGDYARALVEESAHICRDFGARWVESRSLAVLALAFHAQGDNEAARDYARQALRNGPERYPLGQGDSALALGHALAGLGDRAGATVAYEQALDRYLASGFRNPPMEALAGLARLELAGGEPSRAMVYVDEILEHLKAHTLDGTYEPFRIYLTCYRVLQANDDTRAAEALHTAWRLLQERAARIEDDGLRHSFLEEVPAHRDLLQAWKPPGRNG